MLADLTAVINLKQIKYTSHLSLLVLEHFIDAGVEGRTREHWGDGIGQVQDSFKNRIHCLIKGEKKTAEKLGKGLVYYWFFFNQAIRFLFLFSF